VARGIYHRSVVAGFRRSAGAVLCVALVLAGAGAVALAARRSVPRADAHAVAVAINLRHGDLPTLKQQAGTGGSQGSGSSGGGAQLARCTGVPTEHLDDWASVSSPTFANGGQPELQVSSATSIAPSVARVASDFAALSSARGKVCLQQLLDAGLRSSAPKNASFKASIAVMSSPVIGADHTFDYRVTVVLRVTEKGLTVSVPVYADLIAFGWGQAEVVLQVLTSLAKPSASFERKLANVLVARARAQIG